MAFLDSRGRRNNASDLTDLEVGRLKVIRFAGVKGRRRLWLCRCKCGREKAIVASSLRCGKTLSCGCLRIEKVTTHRLSYSAEYSAWKGIRRRCLNPKFRMYRWYGARGITICDRWRDSFENFIADVGHRPSSKHSIERIDNDGNYEPGNVKWATKKEQSRNRRDNQYITFQGRRMVLMDWAKEIGLSFDVLQYRVKRWGVELALTTPLLPRYGSSHRGPMPKAGQRPRTDRAKQGEDKS